MRCFGREAIAAHDGAALRYERLPFDHPLYIMFSSGTTGAPKCIVHGAGGTLLQHLKEHRLQSDIKPGDRFFYATSTGWMMWNWLASGLASEATLLLYDGFFNAGKDGAILLDFAAKEKATFFGTSAGYLKQIEKPGLKPRESHDLSAVRTIASTGSPLLPDSFDYVYRDFKEDVQLASISGGTDIVSCFVGGNPWGAVYRGEIQCAGLGMAVQVWDEEGKRVTGHEGELVCTQPFPSMPIYFWNDADGEKYRKAYFSEHPGIWRHGDFATRDRARGLPHPRALGRHAQPAGRAHRHGGHLQYRRAPAGDSRISRHRSGVGRHDAHRAVREDARRARASTTRSPRASSANCSRRPRRAMCPRSSSRRRICRIRAPASSSSSR